MAHINWDLHRNDINGGHGTAVSKAYHSGAAGMDIKLPIEIAIVNQAVPSSKKCLSWL